MSVLVFIVVLVRACWKECVQVSDCEYFVSTCIFAPKNMKAGLFTVKAVSRLHACLVEWLVCCVFCVVFVVDWLY